MKYAYTIHYVPDVTATIEFYERAFGFSRKFITPENDYGELLSGETIIAFASLSLAQSNLKEGFQPLTTETQPIGVEMGFTTTEIESDFQRAIDAGATVYEPLQTKPWGQIVGYVRDHNGFLIEICTPMSGGG